MPPAQSTRRTPPPRRKILWLRAGPIFIAMMAGLLLTQLYVSPQFVGNPIIGPGSIGPSIITGLLGALLIARFATLQPPPPPSKTQQRKQAAAAARAKRPKDDAEETAEPLPTPASRRRTRRR